MLLPFTSNLGCVGNVNILLKHTDAPYVALSDQDDIWLPEKLSKSLSLLKGRISSALLLYWFMI